TTPTVAGDYLVVGDQEGNLHWLDKQSGQLVSRESFDSSGFFVEPVVYGDKLILYTRDGEVSAVKIP
ncbi:outer membrane protein assembly factor BamB, partial [Pseudoalteromonas ruthenica]